MSTFGSIRSSQRAGTTRARRAAPSRGDDRHPDHERIDEDAEGEREADALDGRVAAEVKLPKTEPMISAAAVTTGRRAGTRR